MDLLRNGQDLYACKYITPLQLHFGAGDSSEIHLQIFCALT